MTAPLSEIKKDKDLPEASIQVFYRGKERPASENAISEYVNNNIVLATSLNNLFSIPFSFQFRTHIRANIALFVPLFGQDDVMARSLRGLKGNRAHQRDGEK